MAKIALKIPFAHRFVIKLDLHLFLFLHLFARYTCNPGVKRPRSIRNWTPARFCTPFVFTNVFFLVCALKDYASAKSL